MKYRIIKTQSTVELELQVEKFLAQGWQLVGGVSVYSSRYRGGYYCQAMIWCPPSPPKATPEKSVFFDE